MINCDNRNCAHHLDTKDGEKCSIPYDNTVHICRFENAKGDKK